MSVENIIEGAGDNGVPNLPTLKIKGKLKSPTNNEDEQDELDNWVPIDYILNWFKQRMSLVGVENRVLILKSETASGKSTLFPPELFKAMIAGGGLNAPGIICTQPRVITAIENVSEMLKHYSHVFRKGDTIGWSTKYNKLKPKYAGLLSATIGTLNQQLRTATDDEIMRKYKFILIDETHERDLVTDMTIAMLKSLVIRCKNNVNCPFVVLMSATFEPDDFLRYFDLKQTNFIWCVGASHPREEVWDWNQGRTVNNYPQAAAQVVELITNQNRDDDFERGSDILIFLPGAGEFKATEEWLDKLNQKIATGRKDEPHVFSVVKIDSEAVKKNTLDYKKLISIPTAEQIQRIGGKEYVPVRRVILTTNVAETGLTLDGLKYVIDAGFNREIEFNPIYGIGALLTKPAPKSRVKQRIGRMGRKFAGVFYPLYPQYIHALLPDNQFPQILLNDVTPIIMDMINEQLKVKRLNGDRDPQFDIMDIDMLNPPSPDAMLFALEKMYAIGFISPFAPEWELDVGALSRRRTVSDNIHVPRFGITDMGMIAMPLIGQELTPESARMILSGYIWNVSLLDLITIAAWISMDVGRMMTRGGDSDDISVSSSKKSPPPPVNWKKVYETADLFGLDVVQVKSLIADEFIDGLILYIAISNAILAGLPSDFRKQIGVIGMKPQMPKSRINSNSTLQKWAKSCNISLDWIFDFIAARDDLIEKFILAEYQFGDRHAKLSEFVKDDSKGKTFIDQITRIKHCIYDGYRMNMITLMVEGSNSGKYLGPRGIIVQPPKIIAGPDSTSGPTPKYIIYGNLKLKQDRKIDVHTVVAQRCCVLDGFVAPDLQFLD